MPKLSSRSLRRIIIAAVFLAVFTLIGWGIKRVIVPAPSCTDGVKNGKEEGLDCGIFACGIECEVALVPPQVVSTALIQAGETDYDFVAEVVNPHKEFGASEVVYELTLFNGDNKKLSKQGGVFYILPGQTKFLVLPFLTTERNVLKHSFKIKSAQWQKIDSLVGINFVTSKESYTVLGGVASSVLEAAVLNDSDLDFETVDVDIILRNSSGEIIGVNKSEIRTFLAHSERYFKVTWPFYLSGEVEKIEVISSTNIFENSNFIKRYGSGVEKFQQY